MRLYERLQPWERELVDAVLRRWDRQREARRGGCTHLVLHGRYCEVCGCEVPDGE